MPDQDIVFIVTGESGLTAQIDLCKDRAIAGKLVRITSELVLDRDEKIGFFIRGEEPIMIVILCKSSWRGKICFDMSAILYDYENFTFARLMSYLSYARLEVPPRRGVGGSFEAHGAVRYRDAGYCDNIGLL